MDKQGGILQYELFFASGETIDERIDNCFERFNERVEAFLVSGEPVTSTGIKTAIRIFDEDNSIRCMTEEVLKSRVELDNWHLGGHVKKNVFIRKWKHLQLRLQRDHAKRLRGQIRTYLYRRLIEALQHGDVPVAIENMDHSFRPIERRELMELIQEIKQTEENPFWLFIFPPNDLLADNHEDCLAMFA